MLIFRALGYVKDVLYTTLIHLSSSIIIKDEAVMRTIYTL